MKKQNKDVFLKKFIPYLKSQNLELYHEDGSSLTNDEYFNMIKMFVHGMIAVCAESNSMLGLSGVCTCGFAENTRSLNREYKFKIKLAPSVQDYIVEHQELINGIAIVPKDFNEIMYELSDKSNVIVINTDSEPEVL